MPHAGLRIGAYKVLCYEYTVRGIGGANTTGPCKPCPGANDPETGDPELAKGPVLFNLEKDPVRASLHPW